MTREIVMKKWRVMSSSAESRGNYSRIEIIINRALNRKATDSHYRILIPSRRYAQRHEEPEDSRQAAQRHQRLNLCFCLAGGYSSIRDPSHTPCYKPLALWLPCLEPPAWEQSHPTKFFCLFCVSRREHFERLQRKWAGRRSLFGETQQVESASLPNWTTSTAKSKKERKQLDTGLLDEG